MIIRWESMCTALFCNHRQLHSLKPFQNHPISDKLKLAIHNTSFCSRLSIHYKVYLLIYRRKTLLIRSLRKWYLLLSTCHNVNVITICNAIWLNFYKEHRADTVFLVRDAELCRLIYSRFVCLKHKPVIVVFWLLILQIPI